MNTTTSTIAMSGDPLSLAREAFTASTTYFDASIRPAIESSLRQFQGVHPTGSKYHTDAYRARSRLFRPKTRATVRKNEATAAHAFFTTADTVYVRPEDEANKLQQIGATAMKCLVKYRLKKSIPWFLTVIGAYQDAQTVGVCASYNHWVYDAKKGIDKPCIELLPVENLRIDPGASWTDPINTSPYVIRLIPMYVKDVLARMNTLDDKTGQPKWKKQDTATILQAVRAYSDTTRITRERGRTDSKDQAQSITNFSIVWVHQNVMEIDGEDKVWYTLGTTGLLTDPVPLKEVYFHGKRPFTMGICMMETHKTYPEGPVGVTKDVQAEINEVTNQRIDNVKFAMNKRYFARRNVQVDIRSLVRNVPGSVTMMNDPEKDVIVHSTPDVTGSSYQEQDRLNLDFDDVAGAFSPSSIQANRKLNETVGGMSMLDSNANQVGAYQLHTFVQTWVNPTLEQLMLLEQYYETDPVLLGMAASMAKVPEGTAIDEILMQDLFLSANVGIGSSNPQDKINNFMLAMGNLRDILADGLLERYGLDVYEVITELFGNLGYQDGDRFFSTEDEDPKLTAAKATIEQLQQQLAQKVDPALVEAQIRKLDAEIENLSKKNSDILAGSLEKNMRAIFASMQAGQVLATTPQVAPVADSLMQAAGYQVPTPAGVDPDFPQLAAPVPGLTQNSVSDPRTGVEFTPGAAPGDTTPSTPATPATGANAGIETMRNEG